jgi:hypothetical protein
MNNPDQRRQQGRAARADRVRCARARRTAIRHGPDGAAPGRAGHQRRPAAKQHPAAVITDIYGFMVAGRPATKGTQGDRTGRRRLLPGGAASGRGPRLICCWPRRRMPVPR